MRKLAIAMALASTALASPAAATDNSWYAGIEGGLMIVEDTEFDLDSNPLSEDAAFTVDHGTGFDGDILGGYDFGMFRAEFELGYKTASLDDFNVNIVTLGVPIDAYDLDGSARATSGMVNFLVDFGDDAGWGGYFGLGVGLASVKYNIDPETLVDIDASDSDSAVAVQGIAGVRAAVSSNIDLGLKYRYFRSGKLISVIMIATWEILISKAAGVRIACWRA